MLPRLTLCDTQVVCDGRPWLPLPARAAGRRFWLLPEGRPVLLQDVRPTSARAPGSLVTLQKRGKVEPAAASWPSSMLSACCIVHCHEVGAISNVQVQQGRQLLHGLRALRVVLHGAWPQGRRRAEAGVQGSRQVSLRPARQSPSLLLKHSSPSTHYLHTKCVHQIDPCVSKHREETGRWPNPFEYCRGKCRTSARSTVHENAYLAPAIHCFAELGGSAVGACWWLLAVSLFRSQVQWTVWSASPGVSLPVAATPEPACHE